MRYLGIDYGSKRVGLALSDEAGTMGFPHDILANTAILLDTVVSLIVRERVGAVVIGESKNLDGTDNPIAQSARAFGELIAARTQLPVHYESEVFTTAEARRVHDQVVKTRAERPQPLLDASAAALILTGYLSKKHE